MSFLDRFFGPTYEKELKEINPLVALINAQEERIEKLTSAELVAEMQQLRTAVQSGTQTLDAVLTDVFALAREAAKRTLGLRHYDVQMIGGMILHRGKITEMRTGEGKTLVATLPASLNALSGRGVHVVTVNDYLARRDAAWMGQVYAALGLTVGIVNHEASYLYDGSHTEKDAERDEVGSYKVVYEFLRPCTRQEAYQADITYGTNSEFGFDYLRDNIEFEASKLRQRGYPYAIIDEIDSILIDEARTPLIISAPAPEVEDLYTTFANVARALELETHFTVDEKLKSATLTDAGIEAAERMLGIENIYTEKGIKYVHHLETAVRAKALFQRDKEYVVRDGEVVIVDEFTGRLQPGRRWSEGLHQAVEAKEGVVIQRESKTYASVTYQNYFRQYEKLSGMTGTALTSQEEFFTVYNLEVIPVPTNRTIKRVDHEDLIYPTEIGKFKAITEKVRAVHATGQPILIGTASIEANERLAIALTQAHIPHEVLNAKNHEREGEIIAAAGRRGAVTVATNMAGRGVDIKLGGPDASPEEAEVIKGYGGLFVLGTERHEARRIDNQLRGRAGRQGDPGETQFFVSAEDSLMRIFGGERLKKLLTFASGPDNQPMTNSMLTNVLESAQKKIEGFHFDSRKQILAYDDVLNQQRQVVYARRHKLLIGDELEVAAVVQELRETDSSVGALLDTKAVEFGVEVMFDLIRRLALQMIDRLWVEHLEVMSYTRSSVNLRAYGQRDPLVEYRKEGVRLFREMQVATKNQIISVLPQLQPAVVAKEETLQHKEAAMALAAAGNGVTTIKRKRPTLLRTSSPSYGRNDLVTITNGVETQTIKYKKAELLLASGGWQLVTSKS